MNTPRFLTTEIKKKYEIVEADIDLEASIGKAGLQVHSWGRIDSRLARTVEIETFSDDHDAARKIEKLIESKSLCGRVTIVWSNALICPIECNIELLCEFGEQVATEDWDCWIFGKGDWMIEKYHEGELSFIMPKVKSPESESTHERPRDA